MQRIKMILMLEVLPATALKLVGPNHLNQMRNSSNHNLNCMDDSRPNFNLRTFKREHLISYKMFDSLLAKKLNMKNAFDPVLKEVQLLFETRLGVLFLRDATLTLRRIFSK